MKDIAGGLARDNSQYGHMLPKSMVQPSWADSIIVEVSREYKKKIPRVKWIQRNRPSTSGYTTNRSRTVKYRGLRWTIRNKKDRDIVMCLGTKEAEHKQVLLHELAHWVTPRQKGHTKKFWLVLKDLLVKYNCLTDEYVKREIEYKSKAKLYL